MTFNNNNTNFWKKDEKFHFLDGTDEEFPERREAMEIYASLWRLFLECKKDAKVALGIIKCLDNYQLKICRGPGPLWDEFISKLPGYIEYWGKLKDRNFLKCYKKT